MSVQTREEMKPGKDLGPWVAVCSARPRPTVQRGRGFFKTGEAVWGRDPYHLLGENGRTLCGRDCSEWLTIGSVAEISGDCCLRCATRATGKA